jgi:hypothetical protein
MERQAILFREDPPPPRVHAILDEQVLHRNVGGPAVMAEQMVTVLTFGPAAWRRFAATIADADKA